MPSTSSVQASLREAVSVSDMARMCSLSRSHFHALIRAGVMPQPLYCIWTRRPFYDRELQAACLKVKATNTGIDGRFVIFYAARRSDAATARPTRRRGGTPSSSRHADLVEGLSALGMTGLSDSQIDAALRACFPSGTVGVDEGVVLRLVWRHLRSGDAV